MKLKCTSKHSVHYLYRPSIVYRRKNLSVSKPTADPFGTFASLLRALRAAVQLSCEYEYHFRNLAGWASLTLICLTFNVVYTAQQVFS